MEMKQKNCESTKKEMNSTKRIIGNMGAWTGIET